MKRELLGRLDPRRHVGEAERHRLMLDDRLAELDALLGVSQRRRVDAARAMPTAWAAMPIRPPSRLASAILSPCPSSPSRWLAGTRISSNAMAQVSDACWPSLFSTLATTKPGVSVGTMKAEMPFLPAFGIGDRENDRHLGRSCPR